MLDILVVTLLAVTSILEYFTPGLLSLVVALGSFAAVLEAYYFSLSRGGSLDLQPLLIYVPLTVKALTISLNTPLWLLDLACLAVLILGLYSSTDVDKYQSLYRPYILPPLLLSTTVGVILGIKNPLSVSVVAVYDVLFSARLLKPASLDSAVLVSIYFIPLYLSPVLSVNLLYLAYSYIVYMAKNLALDSSERADVIVVFDTIIKPVVYYLGGLV